ncbi:Alpha crystallin/Hsp20 domain [Dillenia turbinata]|uniref:Alpha crystallin/Hsp20 domain n=1 Tax=Dillenia turbinata TaxID=194707 RepID=A0AAN8ZEW0_9MAGN
MELELGLKITKTIENITSADLRIAKDRSGPLFLSRETDTKFILTAHLKGYEKEMIKISINQDGTHITISGEKPVQEMGMVGWRWYQKEVEMRGFSKTFRIPDGVQLERIKANFNYQDSVLTVVMPKTVKGIQGVRIQEVEKEEIDRKEVPMETKAGRSEQEPYEPEMRGPGEETSEAEEMLQVKPEVGQRKELVEDITHEKAESPAQTELETEKERIKPEKEPEQWLEKIEPQVSEEMKKDKLQDMKEQTKEELSDEGAETQAKQLEQRVSSPPEAVKPIKLVPDQVIEQSAKPTSSPSTPISQNQEPAASVHLSTEKETEGQEFQKQETFNPSEEPNASPVEPTRLSDDHSIDNKLGAEEETREMKDEASSQEEPPEVDLIDRVQSSQIQRSLPKKNPLKTLSIIAGSAFVAAMLARTVLKKRKK